ncbi:MAG: hypothetical protein ACRC4M_01385 [Mycoplasma sp.]
MNLPHSFLSLVECWNELWKTLILTLKELEILNNSYLFFKTHKKFLYNYFLNLILLKIVTNYREILEIFETFQKLIPNILEINIFSMKNVVQEKLKNNFVFSLLSPPTENLNHKKVCAFLSSIIHCFSFDPKLKEPPLQFQKLISFSAFDFKSLLKEVFSLTNLSFFDLKLSFDIEEEKNIKELKKIFIPYKKEGGDKIEN